MANTQPPPVNEAEKYVDWLNEEKFEERKKLLAYLGTVATALLSFTVAFRKDVAGSEPVEIELLQAHWILLLSSVLLAIVYHWLEVRFISACRARKVRRDLPCWHDFGLLERWLHTVVVFATPITFIAGLSLLTWFVVLNSA